MSDQTIIIALLAIVILTFTASRIWSAPRSRARRLALLSNSQERLKTITAELLEKANDIDQHLAYRGVDGTRAEKAKLGTAMGDLVILSETLPIIDQLLEEDKLDDCNQMLSASLRLAEKIRRSISDIKYTLALVEDRRPG
ncbi:MAG TPA: hypothetical protein PKD05_18490 [Candidatus Melainabacteria bacterium]|nr:hypothetical protein [Candidatus Melainabacteria bacterium]